jgi:hypothetical protein
MNFYSFSLNLDLSLEQEFQLKVMQESIKGMSQEQATLLLIDAARLLMVKDNAIKSLIRQELSG